MTPLSSLSANDPERDEKVKNELKQICRRLKELGVRTVIGHFPQADEQPHGSIFSAFTMDFTTTHGRRSCTIQRGVASWFAQVTMALPDSLGVDRPILLKKNTIQTLHHLFQVVQDSSNPDRRLIKVNTAEDLQAIVLTLIVAATQGAPVEHHVY